MANQVRPLSRPGSGGADDMLVGCLWQNDYLFTGSLGGMITVFSASDLDKEPVSFSGHIKSASALAVLPQGSQKTILSSSYDGLIVRWIKGIGYSGKLERKDNSQIKCFVTAEEELVTYAFDNKVKRIPLQGDQCGEVETIDVGAQPKDVNLAPQCPGLALVSTEMGVVMLRGPKVVSTIKLGYAVAASAIAPDGTEAIIGGQDGNLHIYSVSGDTLTEERVLEKHRGNL
ncbi:Actin-interacting protein 1-2 [Asimina triloba]